MCAYIYIYVYVYEYPEWLPIQNLKKTEAHICFSHFVPKPILFQSHFFGCFRLVFRRF